MKKNKLNDFKIESGYHGINSKLHLKLKTNLAVITGVNGSGKTSMLKYIYEEYSQDNNIFFKTSSNQKRLESDRMETLRDENGYLRVISRGREGDKSIPTFDGVMGQIKELFRRVLIREGKSKYIDDFAVFATLFDKESILYRRHGCQLLDEICHQLSWLSDEDSLRSMLGVPTYEDFRKEVMKDVSLNPGPEFLAMERMLMEQEFNPQNARMRDWSSRPKQEVQIRERFRENAVVKSQDAFEEYILNLTLNYSFSIESIIEKVTKRIHEDSKGNVENGETLREKINAEIVSTHKGHFNYLVNPPQPYSSEYKITLRSIFNPHRIISFDSLSSGEKIIFELICYYIIANRASNLQLLILDEFDANLNPVLVDTYIRVIKDQFCSKDINVILTTHSPSTVAAVDPEDLFELSIENNRQKIVRATTPDVKKSILKKLAPSFVYYSEFGNLEYVLRDRKDKIVFVEGKKDVKILEQFSDYTFISSDGAHNIKNLLICFSTVNFFKNLVKDKLLIALFDFDTEGRKAMRSIFQGEDPASDDDYIRGMHQKEWLFQFYEKRSCYIAQYTPMPDQVRCYSSNDHQIRHEELVEDSELLLHQKRLLDAISKDWQNRKLTYTDP